METLHGNRMEKWFDGNFYMLKESKSKYFVDSS